MKENVGRTDQLWRAVAGPALMMTGYMWLSEGGTGERPESLQGSGALPHRDSNHQNLPAQRAVRC